MAKQFDFIYNRIEELSKRKKELYRYKKNFANEYMFKKYAYMKWKELIEVSTQLASQYKFLDECKKKYKPERKRAMFHLSGNHIGCVTWIPERLITKEMEDKESDFASEHFDLIRDRDTQTREPVSSEQ